MSQATQTKVKNTTRERLVETAVDLIWQSSYGAVSVDDICKAAGVKKGSFYHFFPSKVDLALAAMDEYNEASRPDYDAAFSPSIPPLERFERMVDVGYKKQQMSVEKYGRVCGCPFATLGSEMAGQEEKIRAKVEELFAGHKKYIVNALRDLVEEGLLPADTDLSAKANELSAYIMGQVMMARIQNDLSVVADLKHGILRVIGVQAKEKARA